MIRMLFATVALSAVVLSSRGGEPFVVHEWGTFSTFGGSDGKAMKFQPNDTDLPGFVHNGRHLIKGGPASSLVSLETPVVYFYSDKDRTVSLKVSFPQGSMTDWFPRTSRPPLRELRWDGVKIHATATPEVPEKNGKGRYFAAREVDAKYVTMDGEGGKAESEKFLFYRGVGDFEMPLTVTMTAGDKAQICLKNNGTVAIPVAFVIKTDGQSLSFSKATSITAGEKKNVDEPSFLFSEATLVDQVVKELVKQGLFEKEAKAMVKTWQHDWFAEAGTRVLYFVAEEVTNVLLPMTIEPQPDKVVRVLVGRHDFLTPTKEKTIDELVKQVHGESESAAKKAEAELAKLGRYRFAAQTAAEKRVGGSRCFCGAAHEVSGGSENLRLPRAWLYENKCQVTASPQSPRCGCF